MDRLDEILKEYGNNCNMMEIGHKERMKYHLDITKTAILDYIRGLVGEEKEGGCHKEDGECGCKYLEMDYPCEIEVEGYNTHRAELLQKLAEGEKDG